MSEWLKVKIAAKQQEAINIVSFKLIDLDGNALPPFTAGAHIDVEIKPGLIRQYSMCNSPSDSYYVIAVSKDDQSRGGSVAMHELAEDTLLNIGKPRNQFALIPTAKKSLLFAGGIGVTPLLSMAEQLSQNKADFSFEYCARSVAHMAFINRIPHSAYADRVSLHFDDGAFSQKLVPEKILAQPTPDTHLYVCGPSGFIEWILATARSMGWSESQLHREYFSTALVAATTDGSFEVQIASTGQVFVIEGGQSITNVLHANGVYIPTSCDQGVCGTCLTNVLEGIPDHRDVFLTEGEKASNEMLMPCCSRAKSARLVLDL